MTWLLRPLTRIALAVIALFATWFGGRMAGKSAVKIDNLKGEVKAHDRITKADTGDDISDDDRVVRLREYEKRIGH